MNNVLIHHGIKGMKWGVRHDDPSKTMSREIDSVGFNSKLNSARSKDTKKRRNFRKVLLPYPPERIMMLLYRN